MADLPKYGDVENLPERLEQWIERLSKDKSLPWMGLGLIADLKTAVIVIKGETPVTEYDL